MVRFILLLGLGVLCTSKPYEINLSKLKLEDSAEYRFSQTQDLNRFELFLEDASLLDSSYLFIVLEAPDPSFSILLFDDPLISTTSTQAILSLKSTSGNIVFGIASNFYSSKLENFRTTGTLRLSVVSTQVGPEEAFFKLKFTISKILSLPINKSFTTYLDPVITHLQTDFAYNGKSLTDVKKLRFQLTVMHKKPNYILSADVKDDKNLYELNGLFGHIIAGVLSHPTHDLCREQNCKYQLKIKAIGVRSFNIESFVTPSIEQISLTHYEEYYDRIFDERHVALYELPYDPQAFGLDFTFTLIPVSGVTGLYVNAITLPSAVEKYDWQELGPYAKRITVRNKDLLEMRAVNASLFIAVTATQPGEYLLKIDAHEENFKGRLTPNVVEAGYIEAASLINYIYYFEAFETQKVSFEILLSLIAGDADLFIKSCPLDFNCKIASDELGDSAKVKAAEPALTSKWLTHNFTCGVKKNQWSAKCYFAVAIKSKGNNRAYYHLTLTEGEFHRLMHPGHESRLILKPQQKVYLKFSNASQREASLRLFFQITPVYGSFNVYLAKSLRFPTNGTSIVAKNIISSKTSLYNSMETIEIKEDQTEDQSLFGVYYVTIESLTSASAVLKYFTKHSREVTMHSLTSGLDARGILTNFKEIAYYTFKAVWNPAEAVKKVSFILTPLKGSFLMFLSTDLTLPTKTNNIQMSQDHHLEYEMPENSNDASTEFIIGVQASSSSKKAHDQKNDFQFYLRATYSGKVIKLTSGLITSFVIKEESVFAIEILSEMNDLLLLKSVIDGFNVRACVQFSNTEVWPGDKAACKFTIEPKQVGLHLELSQLNEGCQPFRVNNSIAPCYVLFILSGNNNNQKVQVGFSYNDHPFKLTKNTLFMFPAVRRADAKINLIYHAERSKPVHFYFNSKGLEQSIYTKLVREDHFEDQISMRFPTKESFDAERQTRRGPTTYVYYDDGVVSDFGESPEVLLSIRSASTVVQGKSFNPDLHFTIQTTMDTKEIQKTQIFTDTVVEDVWNYYSFYNNGNSDYLRIYVCTTTSSLLQAMVSKGFQSRPPFTNEPLVSKSSLSNVELVLSSVDLDGQDRSERGTGLRGYYTLAVKSSSQTTLNLFWNNKQDLNYIELTPNVPSTMALDKEKNLYFSFYAHRLEEDAQWPNAKVTFYIKTDVRANFYVLKSQSELTAPSSTNYKWKTSLGPKGGITSLRITASDPDFCSNCLYIGYLDSVDDGQVTILSNYNYSNDPMELIPGFTIPEELAPNEKTYFRIYNPNSDLVDLTFSMLNGFINVYVSDNPSITVTTYGEKYDVGSNQEPQKMVIIAPFRYDIAGPHDFYIMVHNPRLDSASFTVAVDKNGLQTPIEPGMSKSLHLAPGETTTYFYTPRAAETEFEVRFELNQVTNELVRKQAIELIGDYLEIYHMNPQTNDRYKLQYKEKYTHENKVRISFDAKSSSKAMFFIHVYNPVGSSVLASVNLMAGGYKMLSYNEFAFDRIAPNSKIVYEGFGQPSKLFFVDLKQCHGSVSVEFFQGDYDQVARNKTTEFKEIKNDNAIINYITLNNTSKAFVRITNSKDEMAVFRLGVFSEKDVQGNPYSDLAQGNGGKIQIDSENFKVKVFPVKLKALDLGEFRHKVTYTLFLANDLKVMRYVKKCGDFMLTQAIPESQVVVSSVDFWFASLKDIEAFADQVEISTSEAPLRSKLYGVVVATVELYSSDPSYFTPLRAGKVYYDEFVYKTPLLHFPINMLVGSLLCIAFFALVIMLMKVCVFGEINHVRYLSRAGELFQIKEISLEFNLQTILEGEYYGEIKAAETELQERRPAKEADTDSSLTEVRI